ncbi:hypothetical protein DNTS_025940 [Danionella cerebrum]|uniref:Peptidase S54 rhomboid domain-containing protein n=1 Tax=Danionella cerebrum TaxID=2873325 RepID=A0A553RH33_9TELE|nr:hypothetical protein DNTS_025940 [Danionella translucida]
MYNIFKTCKQTFVESAPSLEPTLGIVLLVLLSCVFSLVPHYVNISEHYLSLESSAVFRGRVYQLFTYFLYHENMTQFLVSAVLMALLCSGLEKGIGSIRFLHRTFLLSCLTGLFYALLDLVLFTSSKSISGLVPLALSVLGMLTINSGMRKAYIMGISVPSPSLPWIFLIIINLFVPKTVLLCNIVAIFTGILFLSDGLGWFSFLDISESRASVLEKNFPLRLLKLVPGVRFFPASTEERKKPLNLSAARPGSYPVQAYAMVNTASGQFAGSHPNTVDGWSLSTLPQQQGIHSSLMSSVSVAHNHGYSHQHLHDHRMPVWPNAPHHTPHVSHSQSPEIVSPAKHSPDCVTVTS